MYKHVLRIKFFQNHFHIWYINQVHDVKFPKRQNIIGIFVEYKNKKS